MKFNNEKFGVNFNSSKKDIDIENKKEITEDDILNSNNVELIVQYAKEHKSQEAINKVRELLELARKNGEEIVQNFISSFKECERDKIDYVSFEDKESGKLALSLLEKMPEPFKTQASIKLENYKKELQYNTELFKKHKNNNEEIWKEVFGFDYYKIPDFKERFKAFLFKDVGALSKEYYKNKVLDVVLDPFAINFFVEDPDSFNKAHGRNQGDAYDKVGGFSKKQGESIVNVINLDKNKKEEDIRRSRSELATHESEHAIHKKTNLINATLFEPDMVNEDLGFEYNLNRLNLATKFDLGEKLKLAEDEIFAYVKGGADREEVDLLLTDKSANAAYDYNKILRESNYKIINNHKYFSEEEKQKMKEVIDFLQSEYDKVVKNMIEVVYSGNKSVEFLRNVPINEFWKYSGGEYNRTDFMIKEFKA